jgi:sialic acid synthase SpsE
MKQLVVETERASQALGSIHYGRTSAEEKSLVFRRSLYIAEDMQVGEVLTPENLRAIRPGYGLPPKYYSQLIGKKVNRDIQRGTPIDWDLLG